MSTFCHTLEKLLDIQVEKGEKPMSGFAAAMIIMTIAFLPKSA